VRLQLENKVRILLVDDDADMLCANESLLKSRGFDISTATNTDEAMQRLEQDRADIVLLDVMMPEGIEGFQWLWNLRRHPDEDLRTIPVIILSSLHKTTSLRFHEAEQDETGDYLPVQGFMDKPIDPDVLVEKIRAALRRTG